LKENGCGTSLELVRHKIGLILVFDILSKPNTNMHILYIHQYFATPLGKTGTRSYEFARRWVAQGHKVTMLTTTTQLTNKDLAQVQGRFFKRFTVDGINVLAMAVPYHQQMGVFKRCLSFLAFLLLATVITLFAKKVDVVYATSTPLTVGIPVLAARWFRLKRFVFEVRDQWPESVVEVGVIKNRFLIRMLLWLERLIYKNASAIVAVSEGMAEGIREVAGQNKPIYVVPNGADLNLFRPDIDGKEIRQKKKWDDKLVFLHTGAMGKINSLDFVIDAAWKLKESRDILFVLIGQGSRKSTLENRVKELGLTNVEIMPSVTKEQLPPILAAADVIMVVIGNFPIIERHASLNKFYDGLSAGKPVLLNYSGWQRELLETAKAGFGCELCNLDEFIGKVIYFESHRSELKEMGKNARNLAENKFNRDKLAESALDVIEHIRK
jgi:glycosyltransferase involved in cell wall biosynthesis